MNDFTKEELTLIKMYLEPHISEKFLDKIQSMIDNYCEHHEADEFENLNFCKHCNKRFR